MTARPYCAAVLLFTGTFGLAAVAWAHEGHGSAQPSAGLIRSAQSGPWSAAATWEGSRVPGGGSRVQVRQGHTVVYDIQSAEPIRMIHVAGTLTFAADRDTQLDVGLIKIQSGEDASENGFDCDMHLGEAPAEEVRPALEVGTPEQPIGAKYAAKIRLIDCDGVDKNSWPAIVCCGGRMDFHGAPLPRTWVKLEATAASETTTVTLAEPVPGWRVGDRVIVTATKQMRSGRYQQDGRETEERTIRAVDGSTLTLDAPLEHEHFAEGDYRGEVANLGRNVVVESADPDRARGHTMYHRGSAGSISYAEFRHLGKENTLGRYSLHFHLVGDTMRGSSVVGASIWDSANRWLTIHGTNYLVVRDCVGYRSLGHGFFLEDGTEVFNVLDRNLAVQAVGAKPLPGQVLPFDKNDGAGFWWANNLNTFTRNVTCENEEYGYRFEARKTGRFDPTLEVRQPDGGRKLVDIRTLPFVRFEDNECHGDGLYGFNLGEGVDKVGPDYRHPLVIRNMKIWGTHYAFRGQSPCVLLENMQIHKCGYGIYHPHFDRHVYRNLLISETPLEPFSAGHADNSRQDGVLTVDGLVLANFKMPGKGMPIKLTHYNDTGAAASHFRNVRLDGWIDTNGLVNIVGGKWAHPPTPKGVPTYLHDYFGPGRHAKVVSARAADLLADGNEYREMPPLTGEESRVAEVSDIEFPVLLEPTDDRPPATVITTVLRRADGTLVVRGTTTDDGVVKRVLVNDREARATAANFAEWEIEVPATAVSAKKPIGVELHAGAEDAAGNVEKTPHVLLLR